MPAQFREPALGPALDVALTDLGSQLALDCDVYPCIFFADVDPDAVGDLP